MITIIKSDGMGTTIEDRLREEEAQRLNSAERRGFIAARLLE